MLDEEAPPDAESATDSESLDLRLVASKSAGPEEDGTWDTESLLVHPNGRLFLRRSGGRLGRIVAPLRTREISADEAREWLDGTPGELPEGR